MPWDLVCLSHLRWDLVFQRPNHLMTRAAHDRRVYFVEEPLPVPTDEPGLRRVDRDGVTVVTPLLPEGVDGPAATAVLRSLIERLIADEGLRRPALWYYTPMALPWTRHLDAVAVVYDCMDHLAGFRGAPAGLAELERELIARADLLLTGGAQLYEAKRRHHPNAHCFPSSVEVDHFRTARRIAAEPEDQQAIPRPRLGYAGVIDERLDHGMLDALAEAHPGWQVVLVGPLAKIDEADVSSRPNVHRVGARPYARLPEYLSGWDVGIMPFALNDATRFISPTKTPEYLAAGLPVASTPIHDVVEPYGRRGLVHIGDGLAGFERACEAALETDLGTHRARADAFLTDLSWDATWAAMDGLLAEVIARRARTAVPVAPGSRRVVLPAVSPPVAAPGGLAVAPVGVPAGRAGRWG